MAQPLPGGQQTPPEFRTPLWRTVLRANKQYVALTAVCVGGSCCEHGSCLSCSSAKTARLNVHHRAMAFSMRILSDKWDHAVRCR